MRCTRRLHVLVAVAAMVVAACGGDDSYVDRMEAACDQRDKGFDDVVQPIPDEFTPEYVDHVVSGSVDVIADYLEEVRDIGPPGDDLDDVHRSYVAALEAALERYEAAAGDPAASAEVFNQPTTEFNDLERRLGMETCGRPGNGIVDDDA